MNGVTDKKLAYCSHLINLKTLNINMADVGAKSLATLDRFRNLTELRVNDTKLTGADLAKLKYLRQLISLEARNVDKVEALLKELKNSQNIQTLKLSETKIKDSDLLYISQMKNLNSLSIGNSPNLTSKGLVHLRSLNNLRDLSVYGIKLDPTCIESFYRIKNLMRIKISHPAWPPGVFENFQRTFEQGFRRRVDIS